MGSMAISHYLRTKIIAFDPIREQKTITQFCKEHNISRQTFNNIKKRVEELGPAGIYPTSTAPKQPKRIYSDDDYQRVATTRQQLKELGWDYGPWSIYYALFDTVGPTHTPSRSRIAAILSELGLTEENARKRPRTSYKRWARTHVNELWQIDGLEYRLFDTTHTQVTIYQIIDDASRYDVGSAVFAKKENGNDARTALKRAFAQYGLPQQILSDNGAAFSTYHKGIISETERWLADLGIASIAGYAATTQGKDERSHQTILRYLDARRPQHIDEVALFITDYRRVYNNKRRHQGLIVGKQHITPATARETFPHATPPTRPIEHEELQARLKTRGDTTKRATQLATTKKTHPAAAATAPGRHDATDTTKTHAGNTAESMVVNSTPWQLKPVCTVNKYGCVTVDRRSLYIGLRFKNRQLFTNLTPDNRAEFYTAHDGELLFSVPLPLEFHTVPVGGQTNINHVKGFWHRQPPKVMEQLSKPRKRKPKSRY